MQQQLLQDLVRNGAMTSKGQELDDLVQYIRRILPDQKQLTRLHVNEQARYVEFTWHGRHFVVKTTLEVYELKGKTLMITGASQLMQAALRTKDLNSRVLGGVIETIQSAEDHMRSQPEKAFGLLKQTKDALLRLAGKPAAAARR